MIYNLEGYKRILDELDYWKYNFHIYYKRYDLKFNNTANAPGTATLKVTGITPEFKQIEMPYSEFASHWESDGYNSYWPAFIEDAWKQALIANNNQWPDSLKIGFNVPAKEYTIYTEIKTENKDSWSIIIPEICKPWGNLLDDEISKGNIAPNTRLAPGFKYYSDYTGYSDEVSSLPRTFKIPSKVSAITLNEMQAIQGGSEKKVGFKFDSTNTITSYAAAGYPLPAVATDLSIKLSSPTGIQRLYSIYNEHPAIRLFTDVDNPKRTKFYDWVPLGVEKYKFTLTLSNGEEVTKIVNLQQ